jgi:rhamnulokinase
VEGLTGERIEVIHIVGGGSQNRLLSQFTADACRRPVLAGPVEAAITGNLLVQARTAGEIGSLSEMREVIRGSTLITTYEPMDSELWKDAASRYDEIE